MGTTGSSGSASTSISGSSSGSGAAFSALSLLAGQLGGYGDADGVGDNARFYAPGGVAFGPGLIFVADTANNCIREIGIATGAVAMLAGSPGVTGSADGIGPSASFNGPTGLAYDAVAGILYVADTGNGTIRELVPSTAAVTTIAGTAGTVGHADATGALASFNGPIGLAYDGFANLYVADTGNDTIRQIVLGTGAVTTFAGTAGMGGDLEGIGIAAQFNGPQGLACDKSSLVDTTANLYVADTGNNQIKQVALATGAVTLLAGTGNSGSADGSSASFKQPQGITCDHNGNVYVADTANDLIRWIVVSTQVVTTLAGTALQTGSADGIGSTALFYEPAALVSDGAGNVYVADTQNDEIRAVGIGTTEGSTVVTTLAGLAPHFGSANGSGALATFGSPGAIASDGAANLYVANSGNRVIRAIAVASGAVTTLAGTPGVEGSVDATGAAASFILPDALVYAGGVVYVADGKAETIRQINVATQAVTTLAGTAQNQGSANGSGPAASFNYPAGLAYDGSSTLFVADTDNGTIRTIDIASGLVGTLAGTPGVTGSADGTGPAASFKYPVGLAYDGAGNLFVVDTSNQTIREIDVASQAVTTLAGTPGVMGSADGVGAAAGFLYPQGVASDGAGNLYVADDGNVAIRKIVVATRTVTTLVGVPGEIRRRARATPRRSELAVRRCPGPRSHALHLRFKRERHPAGALRPAACAVITTAAL